MKYHVCVVLKGYREEDVEARNEREAVEKVLDHFTSDDMDCEGSCSLVEERPRFHLVKE